MSGCLCLPCYQKKEAVPAAAAKPSIHSPASSLVQNKKPTQPPPPPSKGMDAVERLKSGFEQFKTQVYDKKPELFEPLKAGQSPRYMVFACADSRCCPSVTLGLQPGEAFTMRNIAAMVPPYDKNKYAGIGAAIEYAVCALKVEVLTVIGHSRCGGIKALLSLQDGAADTFHFVEDWVRIGFQAKKKVLKEHPHAPFDDQCSILEKEAVNVSLYNLLTYPWVKEGVENGTLKLVGARYDFVNVAAEEVVYEVVAEPQEPQGQAPQEEIRGESAQGPTHPSVEQQTQGHPDVDFCPCCVKFIRRDAEGWQVEKRDP